MTEKMLTGTLNFNTNRPGYLPGLSGQQLSFSGLNTIWNSRCGLPIFESITLASRVRWGTRSSYLPSSMLPIVGPSRQNLKQESQSVEMLSKTSKRFLQIPSDEWGDSQKGQGCNCSAWWCPYHCGEDVETQMVLHIIKSSCMTETIMQGTVKEGRRREKRWEGNVKEWTGLGFGGSLTGKGGKVMSQRHLCCADDHQGYGI